MLFVTGKKPITERELATAYEQLDLRERLLASDAVQVRLAALAALADDPVALREGSEALSADVELLTLWEIEQHARWQASNPGTPLISYVASAPAETARERVRRRSEKTVATVVDSLCRKAAGTTAAEADEAAGCAAVHRHRLREDSLRLDDDLNSERAESRLDEPLGHKAHGCACDQPLPDGDGDCFRCGKALEDSRSRALTS